MDEAILRHQLITLLSGEGAHVDVERAVAGLDPELRGRRPEGLAHSVWEQLEHMRITQEDILRYVLDPDWRSPAWPEGYWPATPQPPSGGWEATLRGYRDDLADLKALTQDAGRDLTAPLPHAPRHTLLRELLIAADHAAYHTAQIVDARRALGAWPTS